MGSFNVGCAISNLSIDPGDKIGFMIMGKPKVHLTHYPPKRDRSFYTYANDLYKPFLPPVFGEYGDYGRIEGIVPSVTTELLERLLRKPLDVIMSIIAYDDNVYDRNGNIVKNYFTGDKSALKGMKIPQALVALGFIHISATAGVPEKFVFGNFAIYSHGGNKYVIMDQLLNMVMKPLFYCGNNDVDNLLEFFSQVTGNYPGFDKSDYGIIKTLTGLTGTFFLKQVYDDMSKHVNNERFNQEWSELMGVLEEFDSSMPEFYEKTAFLSAWEYLRRETIFPHYEIPLLTVYKDCKEFAGINTLVTLMSSVNRMLVPSFCGEQHGDDDASIALNTSTDAILKKRLKDSEEL